MKNIYSLILILKNTPLYKETKALSLEFSKQLLENKYLKEISMSIKESKAFQNLQTHNTILTTINNKSITKGIVTSK